MAEEEKELAVGLMVWAHITLACIARLRFSCSVFLAYTQEGFKHLGTQAPSSSVS